MNKKFNLSEKRIETLSNSDKIYYAEKDVKEFIKRLKEHFSHDNCVIDKEELNYAIDKLAGDKLI